MSSPYFTDAHDFVLEHLMESPGVPPAQRRYRYRHCLRVAAIGRQVAEAEGLDADLLELACLVHDVGKFDSARPVDHGRAGARILRPFLSGLGMGDAAVEEICQGVAMHTDGRWNYPPDSPDFTGVDDFAGEPSVLARSVGDCDNVDRYCAYRIHDTLAWWDFDALTLEEQGSTIDAYLAKLEQERTYTCATATCHTLWIQALDVHAEFFRRLRAEVSSAANYSHNWLFFDEASSSSSA